MNLIDYLNDSSDNNELTEHLLEIDKLLMQLHSNGYFVNTELQNIEVHGNNINLWDFQNNVGKIDEYNANAMKKDILELGFIGIWAYRRFSNFSNINLSNEFIKFVSNNIDTFVNDSIPHDIADYYRKLFGNFDIEYMNVYLTNEKNSGNTKGTKNYVKVKTTSDGIAYAKSEFEEEAAYVNVLMIPSIIALIYVIVLVVLIIFKTF